MTFVSSLATNWRLVNLDTGEELEGDFEAQNVTRSVGATYSENFALGRNTPILQFLHGNTEVLTWSGRFFLDPAFLSQTGLPLGGVRSGVGLGLQRTPNSAIEARGALTPAEKLAKMESWVRADPALERPAQVLFYVGQGELQQKSVIERIDNIVYGRPLVTGEMRDISFDVTMRKFTPFFFQSTEIPDTRYHRARTQDYYEILAFREYNTPILGDVVRKRHPDKAILSPNTIVAMPPLQGIRRISVKPDSIALTGVNDPTTSAQRTLRQEVVARLNRPFFSSIIPAGL